jgi:Polysaccharide biosynthesis C-terminal domain
MSIVSFANPLIFGIGNVLTPRSALAWKKGGAPALWQAAVNEAVLLAVVVGAFCLIIGVAGDRIIQILYNGLEYAGHWHTLVVLSLAMFALAVSFPAASALATMERPRAVFVVGVLASASTLVLVIAFMAKWGLTGAAYGYFAGNAITAIGRWMAFYRALPATDAAPLASFLAELTQSDAGGNWAIVRLGEGDHATAFLVTSRDRVPVWQGHERFVVKLFKPAAGLDPATANTQFEALAKLHRALDGFVAKGWTISAARPLHFARMPLATVMSAVRGKHFNSCGAGPEQLEEAAEAFVAGMNQSWLRNQPHGDLGLQNVLFDFESKIISFIDPGTFESCPSCHSRANEQHAAELDLGHLLADFVRELTHRIGTGAERRRRQFFIEKILVAAVADIGSREGRNRFLEEIAGSLAAHLYDLASQAHGLKRVWLHMVLPVKLRCARSIIEKTTNELGRLGLPTGKAPSAATARIAA